MSNWSTKAFRCSVWIVDGWKLLRNHTVPPPGREGHLKRHTAWYSNQNPVFFWELSLFLPDSTVACPLASLWISDGPQSYSYIYRFAFYNARPSSDCHPYGAYNWHDVLQYPSEGQVCFLDSRRSPWHVGHVGNKPTGHVGLTHPENLSQKTVILVS